MPPSGFPRQRDLRARAGLSRPLGRRQRRVARPVTAEAARALLSKAPGSRRGG